MEYNMKMDELIKENNILKRKNKECIKDILMICNMQKNYFTKEYEMLSEKIKLLEHTMLSYEHKLEEYEELDGHVKDDK